MALTTTTLASACTSSDAAIVVTAATGFAAGSYLKVDQEFMQIAKSYNGTSTTVPVTRGQNGTFAIAHVITSNVTVGTGSDWSDPSATVIPAYPLSALRRNLISYSASGAITLPTAGADMVAVLNGTGTLTMTVADPPKDIDGSLLYIVSNAKVAYTVQFASGLGNTGASGSYDVATGNTSGLTGLLAIACNGFWVQLSVMTGTLTNSTPALS